MSSEPKTRENEIRVAHRARPGRRGAVPFNTTHPTAPAPKVRPRRPRPDWSRPPVRAAPAAVASGDGNERGGADGEARHPRGRRRRGRGGRRRARPPPALRPGLPGPAGHVGAGGARDPRRPAAEGPTGRRRRLRPADAGHDGHRGAAGGAAAVPRLQAAAPDGVRRHRRRDPRDQRHRARLLPDEAVGPARGPALPRARRAAPRLGQRPPRPRLRGACRRAPLVRADRGGEDLPHPQPRALPLARGRTPDPRRGDPAARARRRRRRRPPRRRAARRLPRSAPPRPSSSPARSA